MVRSRGVDLSLFTIPLWSDSNLWQLILWLKLTLGTASVQIWNRKRRMGLGRAGLNARLSVVLCGRQTWWPSWLNSAQGATYKLKGRDALKVNKCLLMSLSLLHRDTKNLTWTWWCRISTHIRSGFVVFSQGVSMIVNTKKNQSVLALTDKYMVLSLP